MPTYVFKNTKTEDIIEVIMRISELDDFMKDNPDFERYHAPEDLPILSDGMRMSVPGIGQPDARFEREIIGRIKERVPGNTVKAGHKTKMPREW